jgi:acyl carrier protein
MTKEQISAFCVDRLADLLRIPKEVVDTQTKFSRLGLDSATTVYLLMDLEEKLDLELSPEETFYDHPTIDNLSDYLAGKYMARAG